MKQSLNILALDPATKTGWACETASGTWDFTVKKDESKSFRLIRFRAKLQEIIKLEKINMVVFERAAGFHKVAIIAAAEMAGVIKIVCEDAKVAYRAFSAPEIKKWATGNGRANKEQMIEAAKTRYSMEIADDNQADALHIYHMAKEMYPQ